MAIRPALAILGIIALGIALAVPVAGSHVGPTQATATATKEGPNGQWSAVHAPATSPLWPADGFGLWAVDGVVDSQGEWVGWAVGDDGSIARYDGQRWQRDRSLEAATTAPKTYHFRDVFAKAPDDVWAVGRVDGDKYCEGCGVVAHFDGQRWRVLDRSEFAVAGRVAPLNALDMIRGDDGEWYGWAVGDDADFDNIKAIILRYANGRWRLWSGPNNIAKHLYDVKILSPREAWAVGQDGSESWYYETAGGVGSWPRLGHSGVDTLFAVDLADPLYGWDGGVRGRMNHYSGSCHDDTLDTQCWFDNAAIPLRDVNGRLLAIDIYGVDLLSRSEGWLVGAANARTSTVAYLDGALWRCVKVTDDPGRTLRAVRMVNHRLGWAVGDAGVILRYLDESVPSATPPPTLTTTPAASATPEATPSPVILPSPVATATLPTDTPTATEASSPSPAATASQTMAPSATRTTSAASTRTAVPTSVPGWVSRLYLPFALVPRSGR